MTQLELFPTQIFESRLQCEHDDFHGKTRIDLYLRFDNQDGGVFTASFHPGTHSPQNEIRLQMQALAKEVAKVTGTFTDTLRKQFVEAVTDASNPPIPFCPRL